ncbi:hypothetical protein B0I35DRAFT_350422 [Stachybotrys elegans]|uniref:Uncharacterized protein n=1 Tax=Stachybotrys elegans TaxID=80388 RepID=A0A8K0SW22_9HYPO|nr:hypothetical protein B0I35DRAFT_350422 [Stachybotrys elegans]
MALVFYGRRETVSILDCYLKRNLVKNGGMLDGAIFLEQTKDPHNLALLQRMLDSEPDYVRWDKDWTTGGFSGSYDYVQDDVLYIKMDDDIVFIEDSTIPALVQTKFARPDTYIVGANVINQAMFSWMHYNMGAVKSYLPDPSQYMMPGPGLDVDWRDSTLPAWEGPDDFDAFEWAPPEGKHRWLPTRGRTHHVLDRTPIARTEYSPGGPGWEFWQIAAQEHYSFFDNLERGEMDRYRFHTWDFQYARMGIQFIIIMGRDINAAKPIDGDDEHHFSVTMPQRTGRHAIADGRGVVAHYSYFTTYDGLGRTDVMDRYRSFAKQHICASPMLWSPEQDLIKVAHPEDMEADEMDSTRR